VLLIAAQIIGAESCGVADNERGERYGQTVQSHSDWCGIGVLRNGKWQIVAAEDDSIPIKN
jgi:hypothetical protein